MEALSDEGGVQFVGCSADFEKGWRTGAERARRALIRDLLRVGLLMPPVDDAVKEYLERTPPGTERHDPLIINGVRILP